MRAWWNFVNLSSVLGLLIAITARTRLSPGPHGLLLALDYRWAFPSGGAITVGNVVLVRPGMTLNSRILMHESRHASQYALCFGLPFLVFYGIAAIWSVWRYGHPAYGNLFERAAGLADGGYQTPPPRKPFRCR